MPYDGDDEDAALRARLNKLSGDLKGRAAANPPRPEGGQPGGDGMGSAMAMGLRAGSEFVAAVVLGARDRLGDRQGARDRSGVSRCIFHAGRRGGHLERDPGDFAERRVHEPQFALVSRGLAR